MGDHHHVLPVEAPAVVDRPTVQLGQPPEVAVSPVGLALVLHGRRGHRGQEVLLGHDAFATPQAAVQVELTDPGEIARGGVQAAEGLVITAPAVLAPPGGVLTAERGPDLLLHQVQQVAAVGGLQHLGHHLGAATDVVELGARLVAAGLVNAQFPHVVAVVALGVVTERVGAALAPVQPGAHGQQVVQGDVGVAAFGELGEVVTHGGHHVGDHAFPHGDAREHADVALGHAEGIAGHIRPPVVIVLLEQQLPILQDQEACRV